MKLLNIRSIDCTRPDFSLIDEAVGVLKRNGVVVAPTETRYGLLAGIGRRQPVERIYRMKKRNMSLPTAIFVRSIRDIFKMGQENNDARRLADNFLPGPMTLILKNKSAYSAPVVVDGKIGFRYSSSPVINTILDKVDFFLTATSANISGARESETIAEISALFDTAVDLYLDGGPLKELASTVIDCTGDTYKIVRSGAVSEAEIEKGMAVN